jgi:hypothetical protein
MMKAFKSIIIVKHPLDPVWTTIRDRLSDLAPFVDDIERITVMERHEEPDGTIRLVNVWKANPPIPALLSSVINPEILAWTDRAEYLTRRHECVWRIEPHFFPERTRCSGVTRYEAAIGGRGTRITFEGKLDVTASNMAGVPAFMEGAIARGIESFVTALIPKNFRKLTDALATYLGQRP